MDSTQGLELHISSSPSKVSSRLRSSVEDSTQYAMDTDETDVPETYFSETTEQAFDRLYGIWAKDESSNKLAKADIALEIQVKLKISQSKYYDLRIKWKKLQLANVTMNIENEAESFDSTSNTSSITGNE